MSGSRQTETVDDTGPRSSGEIDIFAPGTRLGERWEILRVLGRGGFSVVYLAHDRELGRDVAVKVLRQDRLNEASLRRFKREAAVARDLAHPHLVRVHDIEQAGGSIFLTLEPIFGGSLRERLAAGPLPVDEVVRLARQLFDGLDALHRAGIVHRDIKPGNVLLTEAGEVKLADFGLALDLERNETRVTVTEATVGTLEYLSPEQALGEEIDLRSDLYSAGIVLYELLTGELPHGGRSSLGTLVARFRQRPESVTKRRSEAPAWLARVVERLLERRREDRYASAREVVRDLDRQRARLARPRRRIAAAVLSLAGLAALVFAAWRLADRAATRFSHIVANSEANTVTAVDRRGRVLWSRGGIRAARNFAPFRFESGGPLRIAASLARTDDYSIEQARRLFLLDPQTGTEVDRIVLAEASQEFPDFAPNFGSILSVADIDGDGADELVVDFQHSPFWPSFSVVVEPRLRRSRVVLVASGHHWFKGAEDLDGDGLRELIYAGINNRIGWHQAIAAVRAPEGLGRSDAAPALSGWAPAMSADRLANSMAGSNLVWYALAPQGLISQQKSGFTIDSGRREIRVEYARREPYLVDFDGFPVSGSDAELPPRETRSAARLSAYLAMAEGDRLEEGAEFAGAAAAFDEALAAAREAALPILELWLRQARNRASVAIRPWHEVRTEMEAIGQASDHPSEIAFDTARALHRAGRVEEALETYRYSFTLRGVTDGRGEFEIFEGALLALIELGRAEEAQQQAERYCRSTRTEFSFCRIFPAFARWRLGRQVSLSEIPQSLDGWPDLQRYWYCELKLSAGEPLESMSLLVDAELRRTSEVKALLESLAAEIAGRSGRLDEAVRRASLARDQLERELGRRPFLRVHAALVRERAARWASSPELTRN